MYIFETKNRRMPEHPPSFPIAIGQCHFGRVGNETKIRLGFLRSQPEELIFRTC